MSYFELVFFCVTSGTLCVGRCMTQPTGLQN